MHLLLPRRGLYIGQRAIGENLTAAQRAHAFNAGMVIVSSPFQRFQPDPLYRYGLCNFRECGNPGNVGAYDVDPTLRLSSPCALGFGQWIDVNGNFAGCVMTRQRQGNTQPSEALKAALGPPVSSALQGNSPIIRHHPATAVAPPLAAARHAGKRRSPPQETMMTRPSIDRTRRQTALGGCALLALAACGGGSGPADGAGAPAPPPAPTPPPVWTTVAVTAPGVQYQSFASTAARATVSYHVFLPPAYATEPSRRFPVLYWLHGSGGGVDGIAPLAQRFQSAMQAGRVPPFIVVFPNGMQESLWVDSTDGRVPMETVVAGELLAQVDATLRTRAERGQRAVEGFSMGGYGAARFGLKFSDRFGAASMLAAGPMQRTLTAAFGPPEKADERERVLAKVFGGSQQAFIDASPWELAGRNAQAVRGSGIRLRLAIGAADSTVPANREFRQRLLDLNLPHEYSEWPGVGHSTLALIDAMGEAFWAFHRGAFPAAAQP